MTFKEFIAKWNKFVSDLNEKGIPMPTIRDPKTGFGSISLTLVFISSVIVVAGIIGKSAGVLGGLDMNSAMEFFWTATSLYFGRQFQTKSGAIFGDQSKAAIPATQEQAKPATVIPPQAAVPTPQADDPDAQ